MSSYPGPLMTAPTNSEIGIYGGLSSCALSSLSLLTVTPYIILDATQFVLLFFSVFVGAMVVTFNTRVLGGQISYLQSVAVLGYCLFPLFVAALVIQVMRFVQFFNRWIRLIFILVAILWCILCNFDIKVAARAFVAVNVAEDRKFVALYPICIFYIFLGVLLMFM